MKTLVIYYTRTGNAKFIAETIAAELGADIEEVIDLKSRQGKLSWISAGRDALRAKETAIAQTKRARDSLFSTSISNWEKSRSIVWTSGDVSAL